MRLLPSMLILTLQVFSIEVNAAGKLAALIGVESLWCSIFEKSLFERLKAESGNSSGILW